MPSRNPRVYLAKKAAAHSHLKTYDRLYNDATQRKTRLDDMTYKAEEKEMEMLEAMKFHRPETRHFDYDAYYREKFEALEGDIEDLDEEEEEELDEKMQKMLKHRQFEVWKYHRERRDQLKERHDQEEEDTIKEPVISTRFDQERSDLAYDWWREHLGIAQKATWGAFLQTAQDDKWKLDVGYRLHEDNYVRQRKRKEEIEDQNFAMDIAMARTGDSPVRRVRHDDPEMLASFDRLYMGKQEYVRNALNNAATTEAEIQDYAGGDFGDWLRILLRPSTEAHDFADTLLENDQSNDLDFVEFETIVRDKLKISSADVPSRDLRQVFKTVSNGDNRISREELVEFMVLQPQDYKALVADRREEREREAWRTRNLWEEDPPHLRMSIRSGISFWEGRFGQSSRDRHPAKTVNWLYDDAQVRKDRLNEKRHEQKMETKLNSEYGGKTPVSPELGAEIGRRLHFQGEEQSRRILMAAAFRYSEGKSIAETFLAGDDLQLSLDDFRTLVRDTLQIPEEGEASISDYDVKKLFKAVDLIDTDRNNLVLMSQIVWYLDQTLEEAPQKKQPRWERPMKYNYFQRKSRFN